VILSRGIIVKMMVQWVHRMGAQKRMIVHTCFYRQRLAVPLIEFLQLLIFND